MIDMIMFGWTFRWFHQKKRLSSDAGFVEYEGFFRSGHLYFYTIQSLRTVYFSVLSNNLSNWCYEQYFFVPTFYKKNSIFCRWNKSTCDFIPHLFASIFLRFDWCSLTSPLVASLTKFTNLQTHSGLEGICLFRKKAFQFELLFYCLLFANLLLWILACLTWAQPSHTHKNWTNRETRTAYQKWSCISLWLCWISEPCFCALIHKQNIPINGLDDVLASCNAG